MKSSLFPRAGALALALVATASATANENKTHTPEQVTAESQRVNAFLDKCFDENVARHPRFASQLGVKTDHDKWDDSSGAAATEDLAIALRNRVSLDGHEKNMEHWVKTKPGA